MGRLKVEVRPVLFVFSNSFMPELTTTYLASSCSFTLAASFTLLPCLGGLVISCPAPSLNVWNPLAVHRRLLGAIRMHVAPGGPGLPCVAPPAHPRHFYSTLGQVRLADGAVGWWTIVSECASKGSN